MTYSEIEIIEYLYDNYPHFESNIYLISKLFHGLNPRDANQKNRVQWLFEYVDRIPLIYSFSSQFENTLEDLKSTFNISLKEARIVFANYLRELQESQSVKNYLADPVQIALVSVLYNQFSTEYHTYRELADKFRIESNHFVLIYKDHTVLQKLLRLSTLHPWQQITDYILYQKKNKQASWNLPHQLFRPQLCVGLGKNLSPQNIVIEPKKLILLSNTTSNVSDEFEKMVNWFIATDIWND